MNEPRPIAESYWVLPGRFLAGEYPGASRPEVARAKLKALLEAGIRTWVDLTEAGEKLEPYEAILRDEAASLGHEVEWCRFAVRDVDVPEPATMTAILAHIDAAISAGRPVYLHCWGGIGRTGTVVGCYLVKHGATGPEALDQLSRWWRGVPKSSRWPDCPQGPAQRRFILDWAEAEGRTGSPAP